MASDSYGARHYRVRAARGKATDHGCVRCAEYGCARQARHWARIHGTDGTDPWADYVPMCVRCHMAYDGITGCTRSPETRAKMSDAQSNRTPDHLRNLSESLTGRVGGMQGKRHSEETRRKMSAAQRARFAPDGGRGVMREDGIR